ncbi:MAG TPA: hypothetical protein K8W01_17125 [Methylorubrum populi]|uniref:Uncharacterized protein n=1 Tax=Methylorubrum populi TaxID=223967 RepID=A0A921E4U4_9HYPH|nr:hypothetical protein [Methylorubrum populi]
MTNIIRPNFGSRSREGEPAEIAPSEEGYQPLHVYGTAAGYIVVLLEDARGPEGRALKVVIGPASGNVLEAVAMMPATDAGRVDADATAVAVLRALEIVEQGREPMPA